ncbi:MAG: SurA N-terminal domain-containing protein [Deltaproteobacteria bacterium]|jgi:peptidyl-prolyl cis-trans isomerase D|nr:SurA N-terminal domain-containing protein [Deltaproteobacteria bacterium]
MLKFIRQRSGGAISVFIIGAIAIVFIFWGVGGQDSSNLTSIGLDDTEVSLATFRDVQRNVLERLRAQNPTLTREMETVSYRQALGVLMERHNLLKLARRYNLRISDAQLAARLQSFPDFQENGRFSLTLYKDRVKRMGQSLATYENSLREDMLIEMMTGFVRSLAHVPQDQILEEFHFAQDKIALNYAQFKSENYLAGLTPTEELLTSYYEANKENYRHPEEIKLQYVEIPADQFLSQVEATPTEIEETYAFALPELTTPETAEVSHILVMFNNAQRPTPADQAETLKKAQAIFERAKTEDFATLAKEVSQDSATAENGGDLGPIPRGENIQFFDQVIFEEGAKNLQKPVGPVQSPMGYHIFLVRSLTPASTKTLEEVRPEMEERVKNRQARTLAADLTEKLERSAKAPSNLAEAAKTMGLETQETDFFSEADGAPAWLSSLEGETARAFRLEIGQLGYPVTTENGYSLYTVAEKKATFIPPLTDPDTRAQVEKDWLNLQALGLAKAAASQFLAQAQTEGWEKTAGALPETVEKGQTPLFRRLSLFEAGTPLIYADLTALQKSYPLLTRIGQLINDPITYGNPNAEGFLALSLAQVERADDKDLDQPGGFSAEPIRERLRNTTYNLWLQKANREVELRVPEELQSLMAGKDTAN